MTTKGRRFSPNPQGISSSGVSYDPRSVSSREELANSLYRLLNTKTGFYASKSLRELQIGEQLIYTKEFSNGMELTVYPSIVTESDNTKKSGKALRSTGYGIGRVYFSLRYEIPSSYASRSGVTPKIFTFNSVPVNRTGTISQIVARINGSINALEDYANYIQNAAAYFSQIARSNDIEKAEDNIFKSTKIKVVGQIEDASGLNNFDDIPEDLYLPETQYGMDPTYDPPPPGIKIESLRRIIRKLIKENIF